MSRAERFLAARWRRLATLCSLVALFGIAAILWARIDTADRKAADLAAEADLRGNAVSTLATDVRKLRTQLESEGKTPVAPDPTAAIDDLPDRAAVPVPIPGAKGEKGDKGDPGEPGAPAPSPSPGATGRPGADGADGADGEPGRDGVDGEPGRDGVDGVDGQDGRDGTNGADGKDGQPPAGWRYTDPQGVTYTCRPVDDFDPNAPYYACTVTSTPAPEQPGQQRQGSVNILGLAPDRRRY
ncbi:collagen-like protein (plasmid) [Streptomyces sp. QHH-9511]|uniref:collagen-like protein n=1 Tax=Streptomyces sp. QHH-9511 TaxID=2684468 RepID=UPI001316BC9A|nr:collagen-like protein [Streptomyces sp. QHH-9511]QGZ53381.1 collagen-like protein [Streptomyces sp. QHH-9511]